MAAASLVLTGGNGGGEPGGGSNANGGTGASVTAKDDVGGVTNGGSLSLTQFAEGGLGGDTDNGAGGAAGAATSTLTFDDLTANATQSNSIDVRVLAEGGNGGNGAAGSGNGGAATSNAAITGGGTVRVESDAYGGVDDGVGSTGADASANASATGTAVSSDALAVGSYGAIKGGSASALATGNGASGTVNAAAETSEATFNNMHPANAIDAAATSAKASVETTGIAAADLRYGNTAFSFITNQQAVANLDLAPSAGSSAVRHVLDTNPAIKSAFGAKPVFYGVGELGGGHAAGGTASDTSSAAASITLDQVSVPAGARLMVGLYGGKVEGHGVSSVSLTVTIDGTTQTALSFTNDTASQAAAAFDDKAFDLGVLSGSGTLTLDFALSVTSASAGSGFYGGIILGDPPEAGMAHAADPWRAGQSAAFGDLVFSHGLLA